MKLPLNPDGLSRRQQMAFVLLEVVLLLSIGAAMVVYAKLRYHPNFAGDWFYALPFWQQTALLAALSGTLDLVWLRLRQRWENPWPLGITLLFSLTEALSEQLGQIGRRSR